MITQERINELWQMGAGRELDIEIAKCAGWQFLENQGETGDYFVLIRPDGQTNKSKNKGYFDAVIVGEVVPYFTTDLNAAFSLPLAEEWHNRQIYEDANRIPFPLWQVDIVDARIDSDTQRPIAYYKAESLAMALVMAWLLYLVAQPAESSPIADWYAR